MGVTSTVVVVVVVAVDGSGVPDADGTPWVVAVSVVVVVVSFFWQPIDRAATATKIPARVRILFMTLILLKNSPSGGRIQQLCKIHSRVRRHRTEEPGTGGPDPSSEEIP